MELAEAIRRLEAALARIDELQIVLDEIYQHPETPEELKSLIRPELDE